MRRAFLELSASPSAVTHGWEDANLELEIQIANHLLDHGCLLGVLLTEVGAIRPDDGEELETDRCDATEVLRPCIAFEPAPQLLDVHPGLESGRVHLLRARAEHEVDALLLGKRQVPLLVPRVAREIVGLPELGRVDEDADDDDVRLCPRGPDQ